jgi:hypothetical protein
MKTKDKLQQIADEFAIGFAEWSVNRALGTASFKLNGDELKTYKKELQKKQKKDYGLDYSKMFVNNTYVSVADKLIKTPSNTNSDWDVENPDNVECCEKCNLPKQLISSKTTSAGYYICLCNWKSKDNNTCVKK